MAKYTFKTKTTDGTVTITEVNIEEGVTEIVIPSTIDGNPVTSIGDWSFWGCIGLTSVEIPFSVTSIGDCAFCGRIGLTSVEIPSSVTKMGRRAFDGCTGLTSVEIPSSVAKIEWRAFKGCTGLTSVVIPSSVTEIGVRAFFGCSSLTSVVIPKGCKVGNDAFPKTVKIIQEKDTIETRTDGKPVTAIGESAFEGCTGLTSVEIPSCVTSIGDCAFKPLLRFLKVARSRMMHFLKQ